MENKEKVLLWESAEDIEKSRQLTKEVVDRFNKLLDISNKWGYDPLTVEQLTDLTVNEIDPSEMIRELAARHAGQLQKLNINQDSIKAMVNLPDDFSEFNSKVDNVRAFYNENSPPNVPGNSNYMVVFQAVQIKNGRAQFNNAAFDAFSDQLRIYADNDTQKELSEHANAAAEHLSRLCEKLAEVNAISTTGFGGGFVFQDYFITEGTVISPRFSAISSVQGK